ncbi:MAG: phosphoribosylanthranilate isomerase [Verrucomicrobiota bacterium]
MSTRVKICGLTNLDDARMALDAGADALGFVFVPGTPRFVDWEKAADWIQSLPPLVSRVALFVDAPSSVAAEVLARTGIEVAQFHGDESPDYCRSFRGTVRVLKAFRVRGPETLEGLERYRDSVDAYLLDAWSAGAHGGTGARFDWELAVSARERVGPLVLAGGLKPDNVEEAVRRVRPYAVDVSSGVELSPGRKDPEKVASFIQAAKSA